MIPISGSVTRGSNDVSSISWYTRVRTIFFFFFFVFLFEREERDEGRGKYRRDPVVDYSNFHHI